MESYFVRFRIELKFGLFFVMGPLFFHHHDQSDWSRHCSASGGIKQNPRGIAIERQREREREQRQRKPSSDAHHRSFFKLRRKDNTKMTKRRQRQRRGNEKVSLDCSSEHDTRQRWEEPLVSVR